MMTSKWPGYLLLKEVYVYWFAPMKVPHGHGCINSIKIWYVQPRFRSHGSKPGSLDCCNSFLLTWDSLSLDGSATRVYLTLSTHHSSTLFTWIFIVITWNPDTLYHIAHLIRSIILQLTCTTHPSLKRPQNSFATAVHPAQVLGQWVQSYTASGLHQMTLARHPWSQTRPGQPE